MATSSTVPTVKARLVTLLTTALANSGPSGGPVQVAYAWPGAATESESVFLGRHGDLILDPTRPNTTIDSSVPTIKAGRKQRQENYSFELTVWSFRPDIQPDECAVAEARAFELYEQVDGVLADDPTLGLSSIQYATLGGAEVATVPFQKGWAAVLVPSVEVRARLT